mgnify:CR=1 FL=1
MISFKTYFYSLIKESPDTLPNAHWTDPDARAFIVHPDFFCLAMVKGVKHSDMLIKLNELVANHQGNIVQPVKEGGILYQGNFSQIEPVLNFTKNGNRSYLLKYSHHKKLGVLVGRIWVDKKEISFWNNIQDVNLNSINKVLNVIEQYFHRDLSTFTWEVFEKENPGEQPKEATYTLDELEDRLQEDTDDQEYEDVSDHGETAVTQTHGQKNPQWDKLHLTPPDKKGQAMKKMGIVPKKPIDIKDRYKLGLESFKPHFYQTILEMPQRITSKIKIDANVSHVYDWAEEIDQIKIDNTDLDVWMLKDQNDIKLWFIRNDVIQTELAFTLFGQGIQENLVIQGLDAPKGLARKIYVNYLLNKYPFILSDSTMTPEGFGFWKKLWTEYKDQFMFYIYDSYNKTKTDLTDVNQMDEVFGPEKDKHQYKFVMVR